MNLKLIQKLKFGVGNKKLSNKIATFSLPTGYTCPGAKDCLTFANCQTGKIIDGPTQKFRCFAAQAEAIYTPVRKARWMNYEALKACGNVQSMALLIQSSLPKQKIIRINTSGDFFSQNYFDAWLEVAKANQDKIFYAYTKSIKFYLNRRSNIPKNLRIVFSLGGKFDSLINKHNLPYAKVLDCPQKTKSLGLVIDKNDKCAISAKKSFALILHGQGKSGSKQAKLFRKR